MCAYRASVAFLIVCASEQIKEKNEIRNLPGEYKKIEPESREGLGDRGKGMTRVMSDNFVVYGVWMWYNSNN